MVQIYADKQAGVNTYVLGEGLEPLEQEWLASEVNRHLAELESGELSGGAEDDDGEYHGGA